MTIAWVSDCPNPAGQMGYTPNPAEGQPYIDYRVLEATNADGEDLIRIVSEAYPPEGAMVFSIWWRLYKTDATVPTGHEGDTITASVTALGTTQTGTISTTWTRWYMVIQNPADRNIDILLPDGAPDVYMCMAQLETGEIPSDWKEGQSTYTSKAEFNVYANGIDAKIAEIDVGYSMFEMRSDHIALVVSGANEVVSEDNGYTNMTITKDGMTVNSGGSIDINAGASIEFSSNGTTTMEMTPTNFVVNTNTIE